MPIVFSTQLVFPPAPQQPLSIATTNPLGPATVNTSYTQPIIAQGGNPPYNFSITSWSHWQVSVAPPTASIIATSPTETTNTVTITSVGGALPYVYAWQPTGFSNVTATAPTSATTAWNATGLTPGTTINFTATCNVSDSLGRTQVIQVPVLIQREVFAGVMTAGGVSSTNGYAQGNFGSFTTTTDFNGNTINAVEDLHSNNTFVIGITSSSSLTQSYFTNCYVTGGAINATLNTAQATFASGGGGFTWVWSGVLGFVNGTNYNVTLA